MSKYSYLKSSSFNRNYGKCDKNYIFDEFYVKNENSKSLTDKLFSVFSDFLFLSIIILLMALLCPYLILMIESNFKHFKLNRQKTYITSIKSDLMNEGKA
jgi:hypothetical protein